MCGGFDDITITNQCWKYNNQTGSNQWQPIRSMSTGRVWFKLVSTDDSKLVYAIGGQTDRHIDTDSCESYDPQTNQWKLLKPLAFSRDGMGAAVLNNTIYVCGGYDDNTLKRHIECEYYSHADNDWHFTRSMIQVRAYFELVALGGNMYAIGGDIGGMYLNTVERYDLASHQWQLVAGMHKNRSGHAAVAYMGKIYVCAGDSYTNNTCESYDPIRNQWTLIAPMNEIKRMADLQLLVYHGQLHAMGGQSPVTDSIEIYNQTTNQWHYSSQTLPHKSMAFGVTVLKKH
ncbi:kelch-like protein 20 [Oppia nitens]|uniref:kelch-like protein 20 n=1 Tax=Oppia nitens TaxID=1686743 RepID=UPI0023DB84D0|nr:kelch-like protein 20 [Oppia nitens]